MEHLQNRYGTLKAKIPWLRLVAGAMLHVACGLLLVSGLAVPEVHAQDAKQEVNPYKQVLELIYNGRNVDATKRAIELAKQSAAPHRQEHFAIAAWASVFSYPVSLAKAQPPPPVCPIPISPAAHII